MAINYSPQDLVDQLRFAPGWHLDAVHHGQLNADGRCILPAADGAVFTVARG